MALDVTLVILRTVAQVRDCSQTLDSDRGIVPDTERRFSPL